MTPWMKFALATAAGGAAAIMAATPASAAATDETVKSLCKVDIAADEVAKPSRRPKTVGFIKRVDGQVAVFRPTLDGVDELTGEVGMDLYAYDALVTGSNGGFDAIFSDNSTVSGVADTCIEISKYIYEPAKKKGEFRMRLGRGVVSVAAGSVAKIKGDTMSVKVRNDTNLAVTGTRIVIRAK